MEIQKKGRITTSNQQASTKSTYGMAFIMNEIDLETKVIGQQVQVGVEDELTLAFNGNMEEQVQANVDVRETFMVDVSRIEVELQKTIDMIEDQEIIAF